MNFLTVKNIISIIYITALIALTCTAIWDVTRIIIDFVHENRYTLAKRIDLNDTFPFIKSAKICVYYRQPLFPDWPNLDKNKSAFAEWAIQILRQPNFTWIPLTTDSAFDFYLFHNLFQWFDHHGPNMTLEKAGLLPDELNSTQFDIIRSEMMALVDTFLTDQRKNITLIKETAGTLQRFFVFGNSNAKEVREKIVLRHLQERGILCSIVPITGRMIYEGHSISFWTCASQK